MDYVADIVCNCSKSRCVYYLCSCFASRLCCDGGCRCDNCHNKSYFEDTVKLFQGCGNSASSSSAGHKKGCHCSVVKCYHDEVGCSKRCRCQDCDHSFGNKPEPMLQGAEYWNNRSHNMPYTVEFMSGSTKVGNANHFWPTRENFSYMNHLSVSTHHGSSGVPSFTSHNIREYRIVSLAESEKGTNVHGYSSASIPKQPFPSKGLSSLLSINDIHKELVDGNIDIRETIRLLSFLHPSFFDEINEMLDSNSINTIKSESPGQPTVTWMPCDNHVISEWNADTEKINNPWNYNGKN